MNKVFLLWHTHRNERLSGGEDVKLLGTFSTKENAEKAQTEAALLEGFKDNLEDFEISEYDLDKREWREGFATITHGATEPRYWIAEVGHLITVAGKPKSRLNYEYRNVMVLAENEDVARAAIEAQALEYSRKYKNMYGQDVAWIYDKIHFLNESWHFNNQVLDDGKVLELDCRFITKKNTEKLTEIIEKDNNNAK